VRDLLREAIDAGELNKLAGTERPVDPVTVVWQPPLPAPFPYVPPWADDDRRRPVVRQFDPTRFGPSWTF
jgi:hypothetical protein